MWTARRRTRISALNWLLLLSCLSLAFLADMVVQFHMPYEIITTYGQRYVHGKRAIARRYLKSWFLLDLLSLIPFDLVAPCGPGKPNVGFFRSIRTIRLLKLAKLLRLFRAMKQLRQARGFSNRRFAL